MFYPVELLSHRRRGKLAPCWLAAMTSEKLFKRYYNSGAIKKINVVETCKEIQQMIQSRNGKSDRFSLYLSSQLMYGITRIHSYQIMSFQKEVFEMQQKFDSTALMKEKRDEFEAIEAIEFPAIELPLSDENFLNAQLGTDLHILPGEDLNDKIEIAMQDATCLNFGCLNNEDLDFMLKHDDNIDLMRDLQISKEKDISEKMADITITENIQKHLSQEILSPMLVDVSKINKSKQRLSLTPQKRQPHQMQVETPTKRRRLSFETVATDVPPIHVEDTTIPAPELPVKEMRMLDLSQQMETDMELELLHSSYFMIDKPSKKGKIIDKKIALNDMQLRKWRQNTNIHCRQLDRPLIHNLSLIPARNLFKQPSHSSMQWNANLCNIFIDHITGPFKTVNEDIPAQFIPQSVPEAVRVEETISKLNFPTEDLSAFGKTDTAIAAKPVDSIVNILPITNIIHETADISRVPLPEVIPDTVTLEEGSSMIRHKPNQERISINNTDESFEDIDILLKRRQYSSEMKHSPVPSTTSSQPALTKQEILALLEVLWTNKEIVKFNELIPKDTYTREDAATAFEILLEFHAQKKVVLQQIDCSRTLRILKYRN